MCYKLHRPFEVNDGPAQAFANVHLLQSQAPIVLQNCARDHTVKVMSLPVSASQDNSLEHLA
jgi:hypothetical protein